MDRQELITILAQEADNGRLITSKHDQANIANIHPKYRSIVCMTNQEASNFLQLGDFVIREYINNNLNHPPYYYEIIPNDPTLVPGSGIPPFSPTPTAPCDRFVVVSGGLQGWHLYTEISSNIQRQVASGTLVYVVNL